MRILTMPAATQNGSNTMGAYVNNVLWVPVLSFGGTGIDAGYSSAGFDIDASGQLAGSNSKRYISIDIRNFNGVGTYILNANPENGITGNTGYMDDAKSGSDIYVTDNLHQGSVVITHFDVNKHIVSGTFKIELINEQNPLDSVYVSSGRFDVTYPLIQLN